MLDYEYISSLIDKYVEIYTYLSRSKLYGELVEVNELEVVLQRKYIEKSTNQNTLLYIPINLIIYINEL
ncbi:MAG: hypothetical protein RRZ84_03790 [Romboutsia sp.]